jgi:hypothetical protein
MSVGRIVLIVLGVLAVLVGVALAAGGGALLWAHQSLRDDDGFFTTRTERFRTQGYALSSENLDVVSGPGEVVDRGHFADIRIRVVGARPAKPVFVGIGPTRDVNAYLRGVGHDVITDIDYDPFSVHTRTVPGGPPPTPPGAQRFWVSQVEGSGRQTLVWPVSSGDWSVVTMNADGSAGVAVDASFGARISWVLWLAIGLLVGGVVVLGVGVLMIVLGARSRRPPPAAPGEVAVPEGVPPAIVPAERGVALEGGPVDPPYPVTVEAVAPPQVPSRWLWLVKWLLLIPHYVVLFFLYIAFVVLTIVAGFAILFTGRYPRGIFHFNVGVLRWYWRVAFYGYGALATDRYPHFGLEARADDPATVDIPYPERLSRGLVLVKWWLLAIPHYLVIGIFVGGYGWDWYQGAGWGGWFYIWSPGLIGILVLFAALALLFAGRYPRDILRLVVGLNRWVLRVVAYAALMRDEYPPFRLER